MENSIEAIEKLEQSFKEVIQAFKECNKCQKEVIKHILKALKEGK